MKYSVLQENFTFRGKTKRSFKVGVTFPNTLVKIAACISYGTITLTLLRSTRRGRIVILDRSISGKDEIKVVCRDEGIYYLVAKCKGSIFKKSIVSVKVECHVEDEVFRLVERLKNVITAINEDRHILPVIYDLCRDLVKEASLKWSKLPQEAKVNVMRLTQELLGYSGILVQS